MTAPRKRRRVCEKMWAVVVPLRPGRYVVVDGVRYRRRDAIWRSGGRREWENMRRVGYRCIRVTVTGEVEV